MDSIWPLSNTKLNICVQRKAMTVTSVYIEDWPKIGWPTLFQPYCAIWVYIVNYLLMMKKISNVLPTFGQCLSCGQLSHSEKSFWSTGHDDLLGQIFYRSFEFFTGHNFYQTFYHSVSKHKKNWYACILQALHFWGNIVI